MQLHHWVDLSNILVCGSFGPTLRSENRSKVLSLPALALEYFYKHITRCLFVSASVIERVYLWPLCESQLLGLRSVSINFWGLLLSDNIIWLHIREKLGWLINSVAAVCFTILVIIVLAKFHYRWGYNYGY